MKFTKKRIIITIVIVLVVGIAGWFWYSSQGPKTVKVEQVDIENTQVRETVSASGTVESENAADLKFLGAGTISKINVKEGDLVNPNQILASLDAYSQAQSAQAAKDARDIALRNRDLFIEQYADHKDTIGGEDQYQIRLRTLNEQISQAQATFNSQLGSIKDLNIKAPFSATIVDILKDQGEPAGPTETIIRLADLTKLYFEIDLDQEDFGKVNLDDAAEVELDAYPNEIFTGKVIGLPQYIDTSNSSEMKIKIQLDAKEGKQILLGMSGDGTVIINQTNDTVQSLPYDAVYDESGGKHYVWVLDNGTLKKKYVDVGIIGDAYTEVKDNLEGQTIVIPSDSKAEVNEGDKGQIAKK